MTLLLCLSLTVAASRADAVAAYAQTLVGKRAITTGGGTYGLDSVGLVRAAFISQGIDVFQAPALSDPERTGVEIVYQFAALNGRLHLSRTPHVGDLVFFGGTRDADSDGEPDSVSHLGIVTELKADGTASIVTATRSQIVSVSMNRLRPKDGKDELDAPLNSTLHLARSRQGRLASELFYTFATLIE